MIPTNIRPDAPDNPFCGGRESPPYQLEAVFMAWHVCRYGAMVAQDDVELGLLFNEEEAIRLIRTNPAFYNAVKVCLEALKRVGRKYTA